MAYRSAGDETGDMTKDKLFQDDPPKELPKRTGICQSCQWFKEKPMSRWQFAVFLLFAFMTPIWLILKVGGITGDILGGIMAIILACYGANHFRILLGLKEQVDRFGHNNRAFKKENADMKKEVSKLNKAREELDAISQRLTETTRGYEENIAKFRHLDEKLSKFSADSIEGIGKIKEFSKTIQASIEKEMIAHERDILHTVQESMELKDDQDGLNEEEYNNFMTALPECFQKRFKSLGRSFADISGDDGILGMDEFTNYCDQFAEAEAKCKCGAHQEHDHDHSDDDDE